jgi:hypothetical protein
MSTRETDPKPDYDKIYMLEMEIYGENLSVPEEKLSSLLRTGDLVRNVYGELMRTNLIATIPKCWCGGDVGNRIPGDEKGLGCLKNIYHEWNDRK